MLIGLTGARAVDRDSAAALLCLFARLHAGWLGPVDRRPAGLGELPPGPLDRLVVPDVATELDARTIKAAGGYVVRVVGPEPSAQPGLLDEWPFDWTLPAGSSVELVAGVELLLRELRWRPA